MTKADNKNYIQTGYTTFDKKTVQEFEIEQTASKRNVTLYKKFDRDAVCHNTPIRSYYVLPATPIISTPLQATDNNRGLLQYRKWWEYREVDICIGGKIISGTPIFVEANALRVINKECSYFVTLEKIDYIRTKDGLVIE